jgi:hypothetical protein
MINVSRFLPCFFLIALEKANNRHKKHGREDASLKNEKNDT